MRDPLLLDFKVNLDRPYAPQIESFKAALSLETRPAALYDPLSDTERGLAGLGAKYFGPQAYSLLAGITNFALPNGLLNVGHLNDEATRIIVASQGHPSMNERDRLHMLQWLMINQTCVFIEVLAALCVAAERWRERKVDIAETYLRFTSNTTTIGDVVRDPRRRTKSYWREILAYPGREALLGFGLTEEEATALHSLVDETVSIASRGMLFAATFLTPEVARLYARYKHGFSLVSAAATPIFLAPRLSKRRLEKILRDDHLMVLDRQKATTSVLILKCTSRDLAATLGAVNRISGPLAALAGSLLQEGRSEPHRSILLATKETRPLTLLERRAHAKYSGNPTEGPDAKYYMRTMDEIVRPDFASPWPRDRIAAALTAPER